MPNKPTNLAELVCSLIKTIACVLSTCLLLSSAAFAATDHNAQPDLSFYMPPTPLPAGEHGDVIRSRALENDAALPHAGHNWLVLYRSTDIQGRPIAVSGTVAVPSGTPPVGGWPTISWTHGTTGTADICAPSRDGPDYPDKEYVDRINQTLDRWLQQGYAIVKTDYEGLGTTGPHPYLIGSSEARSATDMVLAARQLSGHLSKNWLVMGHSQGGQAAIFSAGQSPDYADGLRLVGAVAISPASHLKYILGYFLSHPADKASPFLPLLLNGATAVSPAVKLSDLLTPAGQKQTALADKRCIGGLRKPDAIARLKNSEVLRQDADYKPLNDVLDDLGDSEHVYPVVPLLVLQATNDHVVPKPLTDQTVTELCNLGGAVTYRSYTVKDTSGTAPGHRGTVEISFDDAKKWIARRFSGQSPSTNCTTWQTNAR